MGVNTEKYIRKPLYVDAVRVTSGNFEDIAAWCQGEMQTAEAPPGSGTTKKFIKVRVHNPKNPRQTKAFIGDWLLYTDRGYKVYTNKAFRSAFDPVAEKDPEQTKPKADDMPPQPRNVGAQISGADGLKDAMAGEKTPQGEDVEIVPATSEAIADVVREQQPVEEEAPASKPVTKNSPEAAADKRVLSEEEQKQMGPDEVRELVSTGEAVLAQDLAKVEDHA